MLKRFLKYLKLSDNKEIPGTIIMGDYKNIKIGHNVSFGGNVLLYATGLITIGDNSMIGYGTMIHTSTHDYNDHPMWMKRIDKPVSIGKDVWIGFGVKILPGIKIGAYSVIGTGSVVNKHVPERAIVAGNPAKVIRYRNIDNNLMNNPMISKLNDSIIVKSDYLDDFKIVK